MLHRRPHRRDDADAFVADHDAGRRLVGRRNGQDVEVGAADAARFNPDEDIVVGYELRRCALDILQHAITAKDGDKFKLRHAASPVWPPP
jgi:hypothetical protein